MTGKTHVEIILVGGGPACISAALQLFRCKREVLVVSPEVGGCARHARNLENLAGFPSGISGLEFAERLRRQVARFRIPRLDSRVTGMDFHENRFHIRTEKGFFTCDRVIVGSGTRPHNLEIPGELQAIHAGQVIHHPEELNLRTTKQVLIVGGGDVACDYALTLAEKGVSVRMVVRGEQFRAVERLIEKGIVNLRLYFMVGLPTEEEEDVDAIVELTRRIGHHAVKTTKGTRRFRRLTLSVNQFIPKPATPFQWLPLAESALVRRRIQRIKRALGKERSVSVIHDLPKWNYIQALLSLGDRRVGEILLAVHANGGNWPQALKQVNVNADFYVYREKDPAEFLPWDFIDHGVSREFLLEEYRKAMETAKEGKLGR